MPGQASSNKSLTDFNQHMVAGSKSEDICDFEGASLRVAVSAQPPFVNCLQDVHGEWVCNGSNIDVIRVLEQKLNFRADWLVLASLHATTSEQLAQRAWPERADKKSSDGPVGGLLALVKAGRVWLSANGFVGTNERQLEGLLFSEPFDAFRIHLLLSKSVRDHDHIFLKPFSAQAWTAILSSALFVVPIFYLINTTSSHYLLEADTPLRSISMLACLKHLMERICNRKRLPASTLAATSSTESSFELDVQQVIDSSPILTLDLGSNWLQLYNRREAKRKWALERRLARRSVRGRSRSGFFRLAYVFWYVLASLSNQGGETEDLPTANSTRILIAFWWLYLIVICAIHAGILTAILTFPRQNDFIQTLDDYLSLSTTDNNGRHEGDDEPLRLSVEKNSELAQLLTNPDNLHKSPLGALLRRQQVHKVDFQRHRQRLLDEVQRGRGAYIEERSTINLIISQEYFDHRPAECQFKASKYPLDLIPMSLALSSNLSAACRTQINKHLRRIGQFGLPIKWRRRFEPAGNDCLESVVINAGDVPKIGFKQIVLAHWLLGTGLAAGTMVLVTEIVWLLTADSLDTSSLFSSSSSESSLSSSSSSDRSDMSVSHFRLGHKAALGRRRMMRSAPIKSLHKRINKLPKPTGIVDTKLAPKRTDLKRQRRAERAAKRRGRRLQRTVDIWRRLREGKIYSSALVHVSGARRASLAWVSQGPLEAHVGALGQTKHKSESSGPRLAPKRANNKVKPSKCN